MRSTVVYAVENSRNFARTYHTERWLALTIGKKESHPVFELELANDAVMKLLNRQRGFVAKSVQIYDPKDVPKRKRTWSTGFACASAVLRARARHSVRGAASPPRRSEADAISTGLMQNSRGLSRFITTELKYFPPISAGCPIDR